MAGGKRKKGKATARKHPYDTRRTPGKKSMERKTVRRASARRTSSGRKK